MCVSILYYECESSQVRFLLAYIPTRWHIKDIKLNIVPSKKTKNAYFGTVEIYGFSWDVCNAVISVPGTIKQYCVSENGGELDLIGHVFSISEKVHQLK